MIVQAKIKLYISCPSCRDGSWRADQLNVGFVTTWSCQECGNEATIRRISESDFEVTPNGMKDTPVVVTLQSITEPKITVRLNTRKWSHSRNDTPEEYAEHQRFFYNMHTCPTNWIKQVEEITFENDRDPHGVFEFVSVEDGRLVDSPDCSGMIVEKI
jgi:hypothetical protein